MTSFDNLSNHVFKKYGAMKQKFLIIFPFLWVTYIFFVSLYYPVGGDEPGYYYSILQILDGKIPILDFLAIQPPGFFIPYVLIGKWLSPTLEALRLVSLASIIGVTFMTTLLAERFYGRIPAVFAFLFVAFSHFWLYWNVQLVYYPISNFAIVLSFFLIFWCRPSVLIMLLAGFAAGWATNSRLPLVGATLVAMGLAAGRMRREGATTRETIVKGLLPFCVGGLLSSLPTLYLLVKDPSAFFFNLLGARLLLEVEDRWLGLTVLGTIWNWIWQRLYSVYAFFFLADTSLKAMIGNSLLLIPFVLSWIGYAGMDAAGRAGWREAARNDPLIRAALWMIFGIVLTHFLTIVGAEYMQAVFPFIVLCGLGLMAHGGLTAPSPKSRWAPLVLAVLMVPYVGYYMFWTGTQLIRRAEPSHARPFTAAQVACWLEQNTQPDSLVMSYRALPVAIAHRRLPPGFEYNNMILQVFWARSIDETMASHYHILRREDFLNMLRSGAFSVFVNDNAQDHLLTPLAELPSLLEGNYRLVTGTGGAFPYDIYVRKDLWRPDLPKLPKQSRLEVSMAVAGGGNVTEVARLIAADIGLSFLTLPGDLIESLARLADRPFEARCAKYLHDSQALPPSRPLIPAEGRRIDR